MLRVRFSDALSKSGELSECQLFQFFGVCTCFLIDVFIFRIQRTSLNLPANKLDGIRCTDGRMLLLLRFTMPVKNDP